MNYVAVNAISLRFWLNARALSGAILGALLTLSVLLFVHAQAEPPPPADKKLEKGCVLPKTEAEATLWVIVDGKLRCYRWN